MKKIMILIALVGLTGMVNAQSEKKKDGLTTEQKADKMTAKMKKSLNLTEAQVLKVKEANINFVKERENMRIEIRQKNKQIRESHKTNLQSILTPEQFKIVSDKMDKKEKKMKRKMKE
jgi:type II secretory pathway component PulL